MSNRIEVLERYRDSAVDEADRLFYSDFIDMIKLGEDVAMDIGLRYSIAIDSDRHLFEVPADAQVIAEAFETKASTVANRQKLLDEGALTEDGKMWFNEATAKMFLQKASTIESVNAGLSDTEKVTFRWKDKDRLAVTLAADEVKAYCVEIINTLDNVYLDMEL